MKKIFLAGFTSLITGLAFSQSAVPADARVMSTAEAKAQQGGKETMINGKPYSQYKAEQDALKNQSKTAAVQTYATSNSGAVNYVAEVNTKPAPVQRTTPETGVNTPKTVTVETKEVVAVQQSSSEPRPGLMANNPAVKTVEPKPVEKRNENPQQESKTSVTQKADVKTDKADVPPTNAVNPLIQTLKLETAPVETKTEEKTTPAPVGNDSKAKTKTD